MGVADYDHIIVGAGSAGCVLANRLSADPKNRVLLIEAGGRDRNPLIRVPKGFGKTIANDKLTWHFPVRPIGPSRNVEQWVRGKTLGGSSAVNGMVYNRGSAADYDALVSRGNPGWGWSEMLPIFRAMENHTLGANAMRGAGGPLDVSVDPGLPDICRDMIEAGAALGWSAADDINGSDDERIGPAARTIKSGRRVSSAHAFLHPAESRDNLTVAVDSTATRIVFEGDKAVGIQVSTGKGPETFYGTSKEIILCLGSITTPKLLQLSGIGDRSVLHPLGIDTIVDSPNVGHRMLEHRCVAIQFRLNTDIGYNRLLSGPMQQAITGIKYLANRQGPLAGSAYDVIGFFKTHPDAPRPDAQILIAPFSAAPFEAGKDLRLEREPGVQAIGYVLRPTSEGSVTITSANPLAPLDIDPRFFETDHDRQIGARILRSLRDLFQQEPLASHIVAETRPGTAVGSDEEIINSALDDGYCGYHAVGTCGMGPELDNVVDASLRVRGVDGLRIMDASVLPTMVSGNLNGPIMTMAWRAADLILDGS